MLLPGSMMEGWECFGEAGLGMGNKQNCGSEHNEDLIFSKNLAETKCSKAPKESRDEHMA